MQLEGDWAHNAEVRNRVANSLEFPLLGAVGVGIIVYAFSRVMLWLSKTNTVVAFSALAGVVLASRTPYRWQWLPYIPAIAMSGAVVFTGNHYIIDAVAGVCICLGGLAVARYLHEPSISRVRAPVSAGTVMLSARRRD